VGLDSVTAFGRVTLGSCAFGVGAEWTGTAVALASGGVLTVLAAGMLGPRLGRGG